MTQNSKQIAVLAFPFATHAAPLLNLAQWLSSADPTAEFTFFSTANSNNSLFPNGSPVGKIKPYNVQDGLPAGFKMTGNPHEPVGFFLKAVPENFRTAIKETGIKFTCLVTDAFFWFGSVLAEEMNVPWVPLWTAGPRSLQVHVDVDIIRKHIKADASKDETLHFLPEFSGIRVSDLPEGITTKTDVPIPALLDKMGEYLPRAAAVAINSFEELDPVVVNVLKSRFNEFLNIGPLALTYPQKSVSDEHNCIDFLNKQDLRSVAYISLGSVITPPPHELSALAAALDEIKIPFIWSFRGNMKEKFPEGFIERNRERGLIVPWAPQSEILAHSSIGAFVTHCGWNSVLESIIGGVPMICRPYFGDQHLNVRTVESVFGIGVGVEGGVFTKDGVIKALKSVIESGDIMRENVRIRQELAFSAVKTEGSSIVDFNKLVEIVTQ